MKIATLVCLSVVILSFTLSCNKDKVGKKCRDCPDGYDNGYGCYKMSDGRFSPISKSSNGDCHYTDYQGNDHQVDCCR